MVAAGGYQESLLDQHKKSRVGAVGILQVIPKLAAAAPIDISNVTNADGNMQAGCKILRHITDTYFNDPGINPLNQALLPSPATTLDRTKSWVFLSKHKTTASTPTFGWEMSNWKSPKAWERRRLVMSALYKYFVAYKLIVEQKQPKQAMLASE